MAETRTVRLRATLGAPPTHRVARNRFYVRSTEKQNVAFAKDIAERVGWLKTRDGRTYMRDKRYQEFSVAQTAIEGVLRLAAQRGMSPLHLLESALLGYRAIYGGEDMAEAEAAIAEILDRADADLEARMTRVRTFEPEAPAEKALFEAMKVWCVENVEGEWLILQDSDGPTSDDVDDDGAWIVFGFIYPPSADAFRQRFGTEALALGHALGDALPPRKARR